MVGLLDKVENIVEKRENAGYQHFLPFPTMFSKSIFLRVVKVGILCRKVTHNDTF